MVRQLTAWLFCIALLCSILDPYSATAVELGNGLVAEWTFKEASGEIVRDTSDNNNTGILKNGPLWVKDGIGTALEFDGVDDYVDCGSAATLDITERISLEAWVKPSKPSIGEPMIVGKGVYVYALTWTGSHVYCYISDGAWKANAQIPLNQWSHVVGTYDGKRIRLYVNGLPASGFVMPRPHTPIKSTGEPVLIGKYEKGFFCGRIDNVRIYNRVLSEKEVAAHYAEELKQIKPAAIVQREGMKGFARKVSDLGGKPGTVVVSGVETIDSNVTVPANILLRFEMGGRCDVQKDARLTSNGPIQAPLAQIFQGAGAVEIGNGRVEKVYPQWWGAKGDGVTDDASAIQAAVDALPSGGIIAFHAGTYNLGAPIRYHSRLTFEGGTFHSRNVLPALFQSKNPAARTGAVRFRQVSISGRAVDGDRSAVGIDMTNLCSSLLEDVRISSCDVGIKMNGPVFCGYNNLMRLSIGACRVGIELRNSTIKTSLIASSIGAVETGILVATANELDIFGVSIEGFSNVGVDVQTGDTIHMQHLYFANGVESGTGIRIAQGVSECTIINPRYSRVERPIDNQSSTTLIIDEMVPSDVLRTRRLFAQGISASAVAAHNMRGCVTLTGTETRSPAVFEVPESDENYFVVSTATALSEGLPPGALHTHIESKAKGGFWIVLDAAPGEGKSVRVDWIMVR